MSTPSDPTPLDLGRAAAARLGNSEWQVEAEPILADVSTEPAPAIIPLTRIPEKARSSASKTATDTPPPPDRILEALLFVGGTPLKCETVSSLIRGLTPDRVREMIDHLNKTYRLQNRPYTIQSREDGFTLVLRSEFQAVREKLFSGPREARLTQQAMDVLSLVAYRQPVTKADIDALRGADSGSILRQLVRLSLIALVRRAESEVPEVCYGTTPRFLELFGLTSLHDLPRLAENQLT